jgi:hypothetical protein
VFGTADTLGFPATLVFDGDGPDELPDFAFGLHSAGGPQTAAQFSVEALDQVA